MSGPCVKTVRWRRPLYWLLVLATALRIGWYLWNASGWQNSTRELMGLPDVEAMHYVRTLLVSAAIALLLIGLGCVWVGVVLSYSRAGLAERKL